MAREETPAQGTSLGWEGPPPAPQKQTYHAAHTHAFSPVPHLPPKIRFPTMNYHREAEINNTVRLSQKYYLDRTNKAY
jgi:hypothetical protein